jgi:hypothetical protein
MGRAKFPLERQCRSERAGSCTSCPFGTNQASVLSYIDGFMLLGFATVGVLLLMLILKDPLAQPVILGSAAVVAPG